MTHCSVRLIINISWKYQICLRPQFNFDTYHRLQRKGKNVTVTKHCSSDASRLQAAVENWSISRAQGKMMWVLGDPSQTLVHPNKSNAGKHSGDSFWGSSKYRPCLWVLRSVTRAADVQIPHRTAHVSQLQDPCLLNAADFLHSESVER